MATLTTSIVTGGSNSHETSAAEVNALATDFIAQGVVGAISATSGVAPTTGAFAVNAQSSPDMSVRVTAGVAYVTGTPTGGVSQTVRVSMDTFEDVVIAANATGGTRYDWVYIKLDADKLVNPAVDASDVASLVTSRSTSASVDNGTPPTYGYCIAVVTVANGAATIVNGNITDARTRTGVTNLTTSNASNNVVTAPMLSTSAITLGYTEITSLFTHTAVSTVTDVPNLSVTVTVPAGGRRCKITAFSPYMSSTGGAPNLQTMAIRESSTTLNQSELQLAANYRGSMTTFYSAVLSAGSHTYKVSISQNNGGTQTFYASATQPAFILVEAI